MSYIMTGRQLADFGRGIALNEKTLYVMGAFGAPATDKNKLRYTGPNANEYNRRPERTEMILNADPDAYFFDCVGLAVKAPLWGWNGNRDRPYGGAVYEANGVPDIGADSVINRCTNVSTAFNEATMKPGEYLWKKGHAGIYIGGGIAVECTPSWKNGVQITAVANIGQKSGYSSRTWTKHGRLPWVDYSGQDVTVSHNELAELASKAEALAAALRALL